MSLKNVAWLKISGISGIFAPLIAFMFISLAIVYSPQFSWTENALSDLGVQEGATAMLFNCGLIIAGILALIFASGLLMSQKAICGKVGAFILVLAAFALTAIGVFPEDVKPTHYYVSVGFFVLLPISILVLSATFFLEAKVKLGLFTFLVAAVATAVWIIHWTIPFGSGVAILEALSAASASTCSIVLGFKMLKEASHSTK
jgi:hypothetical membrane protein